MTRLVHPGIYEDLVTAALGAGINARTAEGWRVEVRPADATIRPEFLARHVYMLVRERKRDARGETLPYHCLGRARYRSHESERPMKILWELDRPMPGWLYQAGKVVAG